MADIYDRARATATRMLALRSKGGKGAELTIIKASSGGGEYVPGQPVDPGQARFITSGVRIGYENTEIDGTRILAGDVKLLVSPVLATGADTPECSAGDEIQMLGQLYTVISAKPWNYAGLSVGAEIQARGVGNV